MSCESVEIASSERGQAEDPALARKRRIERRSKSSEPPSKRSNCDKFETEGGDAGVTDADLVSSGKPSVRGIKKQARYEPGVPMSKEELVKWRKEARRVRNRESAAASRQRTRERINELEAIVEDLESKYSAALDLIKKLQAEKNLPTSPRSVFSPEVIRQLPSTGVGAVREQEPAVVSLPPSVVAPTSPEVAYTVSPPLSPRDSFSLHQDDKVDFHQHKEKDQESKQQQQHYEHIIQISRPTAV